MKALGVLGLGLFVAGFWTLLAMACVHKDKPELAEPQVPERSAPPATDAVLEFSFPSRVGESMAPALGSPEMVTPPEPVEDPPPKVSMFSDPLVIAQIEKLEALQRSRLGSDGRYTVEESQKRIAALEVEYLSEEGETLSGNRLLRPLTEDERAYLVEEDRNGWGGSMIEGFEHHLKVWGILLPATNPPE